MNSNLLLYQHYCSIEAMCASVSELTVNGTKITTTVFENPENKLTLGGGHEVIFIDHPLVWNSSKELFLSSENSIVFGFNGSITNYGDGTIYLHSGADGVGHNGTLVFPEGQKDIIKPLGGGEVIITYNPMSINGEHKYHHPQSFSEYVSPNTNVTSYMLVNNAQDLQDINKFPSGNYALSQDIDLSTTYNFQPIGTKDLPFTGHFNGNGHTISNLHIDMSDNDLVSLFGLVIGQYNHHAVINDLRLSNFTLTGNHYVGSLFGMGSAVTIENVNISNGEIKATSIVGGIVGTGKHLSLHDVKIDSVRTSHTSSAEEDAGFTGALFGAIAHSKISLPSWCDEEPEMNCIGHCGHEVEFL